jgi:hypothetical protein
MERAALEIAVQRYLDALFALPGDRTRIIGFDSHELPGGTIADSNLSIFREHADSYTRELIGDINYFAFGLHQLEAWRRALELYADAAEQLSIFAEFVEPLFVYALTSPYALKNRFIYCGVKLIALAAALQSPSSPTPIPADREINFNTLKDVCGGSPVRESFRDAVSKLNSDAFTKATRDFRHRREHRLPPNLHLGILAIVETEETPTGLSHTLMVERPLRLEELIPMLDDEHRKLTITFAKYWQLILDLDATLATRSYQNDPGS